MTSFKKLVHLGACYLHLVRRAADHGIELGEADIDRLENSIKKMQPCFIKPDQERYHLKIKYRGQYHWFIYDMVLGCLVTINSGTSHAN